MMKTGVGALFVAVVLAMTGALTTAQADTRSYVWTYEYGTMPKGGAEVEYYFTVKSKNGEEESEGTSYEHQIELEYGVTDRLDVGMYQVFKKEGGESLDYEGFKLKARYRFGERGKYPVDPEIYLEYENSIREKDALEAKLILAKDLGKVNLAYNQIAEVTTGRGGKVEHEFAAGASYALLNAFRLGVEAKGSYSENEYAAGPTLSWAGSRLWANVGVLFGMNDRTPNTEVRFLVGVPF